MSRITGSDAKGLMGAYAAIHTVKEENNEQIWEEVENWVNSLLDEGYDLSDYTWEEMYEAYIEEAPMTDFEAGGGQAKLDQLNKNKLSGPNPVPIPRSRVERIGRENLYRDGGGNAAIWKGPTVNRGGIEVTTRTKDDVINRGRYARPAAADPTPAAPATTPAAADPTPAPASGSDGSGSGAGSAPPRPAAPVLSKKGGVEGTGVGANFKARAFTDAERSRYASVAAKNAAAKPAPAATPRPKDTSITDMIGRSQVRQGAPINTGNTSSDARAIAARSSVANVTAPSPSSSAPTPAAAPKPPTRRLSAADQRQGIKASYEYDAYDLVLEYLLSEGHVDTVEEANYVMLEMDAEMIQSICEAAKDQSDKQIEKGVKTTYKAGNVLDNTHQGRSPGLNKLPAGERKGKTERMRGRLKSRRDDLFGERNKREDKKMGELKKRLGL
jgi:hypothetical protein